MAQISVQDALALGMRHHSAGNLDQAESIYRQVLVSFPDHPYALHLLGVAALDRGKIEEAIDLIRKAIAIHPDDPHFHFNLGVAEAVRGRWEDAVAAYQKAAAIQPDYADAHNNLAGALLSLDRAAEAVTHYLRAVGLRPDSAVFENNLSSALCRQGALDEAIQHARRAGELDPKLADSFVNLGSALHLQGDVGGAIEAYHRAIDLQPDHANAHYSLGLSLIANGDLAQGWTECEWRLRVPGRFKFEFPQPAWDGSPLTGRSILLWHEQGFGDTLQFVRYVPILAEMGARVLLLVPPELKRLSQGIHGVEAVMSHGDAIPACDFHCPVLSLPHRLGTDLSSIPSKVPYLNADPGLVADWRSRLAILGDAMNVGIVWAGQSKQGDDRNRSMQLASLLPLANLKGVRFFSLQKGAAAEQIEALRSKWEIVDLGSSIQDFADSAAIVSMLDLVISVDSAPCHLAGGSGIPVWVLLPLVSSWRWMRERADSPWYPTARLFRQTGRGDWQTPVLQIADALAEKAAQIKR